MATFVQAARLPAPLPPGRRLSGLLAAVAMVMTVAIPWLTGRAIDQIRDGDKRGPDRLGLVDRSPRACCAWRSPSRAGWSPGASRSASSSTCANRMYGHLLSLELGFFDRQQTGQLMSRATVDLQAVRFFLGYGLVFIMQSALTIVLAGGRDDRSCTRRWRRSRWCRCRSSCCVAARYGRRARPALQEVQQRIAELTADVEENIGGVRVVKAFAREDRQLERFRGRVGRVFDQAMVSTRLQAFYNPFIGFLPQIGLAAILFFGGRQVIDGRLTLGEFTAFYAYLLMLLSPMRTLGISLGLAQRATASGARVFQILDREPRIVSAPGAPRAAGRLRPRRAARRRRCDYEGARAARAARRRPRRARRDDGRARRRHRLGQDDARAAAPAPLRRHRGRGAHRRRRRARRRPRLAARRDRRRRRRPVPVQRHRRREHRLRARRRDARGDRARRAPRPGPRLHRAPARRLRHARRRARADAQRRPAPARRDRPRASWPIRASSSSTTRPRRSTPRPSRRSSRRCAR